MEIFELLAGTALSNITLVLPDTKATLSLSHLGRVVEF